MSKRKRPNTAAQAAHRSRRHAYRSAYNSPEGKAARSGKAPAAKPAAAKPAAVKPAAVAAAPKPAAAPATPKPTQG